MALTDFWVANAVGIGHLLALIPGSDSFLEKPSMGVTWTRERRAFSREAAGCILQHSRKEVPDGTHDQRMQNRGMIPPPVFIVLEHRRSIGDRA